MLDSKEKRKQGVDRRKSLIMNEFDHREKERGCLECFASRIKIW